MQFVPRTLFFLLLTLFTFACADDIAEPEQEGEKYFFDLASYFTNEAARLDALQPRVRKEVYVNGTPEKKTLDSLDYTEELNVFTKSDINRKAWIDKYTADSTAGNGLLEEIVYEAIDEKLKTRRIVISFQDKAVSSVQIENQGGSFITKSVQKLLYDPLQGYSIESTQDITLSKEQQLMVKVSFLP